MKRVLAIAPHPDDESIGCGGALALHARRGDRVSVVFLTSGELGLKHLPREEAWRIREAEARRACRVLGAAPAGFLRLPDWTLGRHAAAAARALGAVLARERPAIVYLPHPGDGHPDHRAAARIARAALRAGRRARVPQLRAYEVWTPLAEWDLVLDVGAVFPTKLRALRAHRSQLDGFDYVQAVRGLGAFRGALAGRCAFAEVFRVLALR
jgi:LmbE family N-acetylglucosaminyl deacetylase